MNFIEALLTISPTTLLFNIAAFIVALIVIVFVHEYGHFIIGRLCGVKVDTFSVGFGKELLGFTDKKGTRWKLAAWPVGGYVKFEGDANAASVPDAEVTHTATSLHAQAVWKRMAIVAAGPMANFILAAVIFAIVAFSYGQPYVRPVIGEVLKSSAAEKAGILAGDLIKQIDGKAIRSFTDVVEAVIFRPNESVSVVYERNGQEQTTTVQLLAKEEADNFGGTFKIGQMGVRPSASQSEVVVEYPTALGAAQLGVLRTVNMTKNSLKFIGKMITGEQSVKQLGGAISIGKGAGDAASAGLGQFLFYLAFLSLTVGIVNLFPIPMLDGGHLVFYAIEAVRGKPLGPVAMEWGYRIGFSCVLMLMLLGLFNDAGRVSNVLFRT
jgi:regulator of sigma E protease